MNLHTTSLRSTLVAGWHTHTWTFTHTRCSFTSACCSKTPQGPEIEPLTFWWTIANQIMSEKPIKQTCWSVDPVSHIRNMNEETDMGETSFWNTLKIFKKKKSREETYKENFFWIRTLHRSPLYLITSPHALKLQIRVHLKTDLNIWTLDIPLF